MNALDVLRATGPIPAARLAQLLGVEPEAVYPALVAAEGAGLARVVIEDRHGRRDGPGARVWEAMA